MFSSGGIPRITISPTYGEELRTEARHLRRAPASPGASTASGSARYENHVRINKDVVDAWGIPVIHMEYRRLRERDNHAKDAADTPRRPFRACGWDILSKTDKFFPPGRSIHEMGTCRMGDDPKTSVLNRWNQSHDIKNLFVVDAAGFVTCGWQNPDHDHPGALHARLRAPRRTDPPARGMIPFL